MSRSNQATAQSAPCDEGDKAEADLDHEHNHNEQEANKMATVGGREQLRVLLDFVGKGDVLVVTKLDRLGRNLLDILVIQEIEAKGAQLVSIGERFDTTSPMGVAMFQVAGVFAQLERAMIRLRQREGIEAAKKAGRYRGGKQRSDPATIRQLSATGMRPIRSRPNSAAASTP